MFCKYCKKFGHVIDKCYKFHDFPFNFKFTKGRRIAANATTKHEFPGTGHIADGSSHSGTSSSS